MELREVGKTTDLLAVTCLACSTPGTIANVASCRGAATAMIGSAYHPEIRHPTIRHGRTTRRAPVNRLQRGAKRERLTCYDRKACSPLPIADGWAQALKRAKADNSAQRKEKCA